MLSGNQLSQLPPQIGELKELRRLYLNGNNLGGIPIEITRLSKLTHLVIDGNQFIFLPDSIVRLENLQYLSLTLHPQSNFEKMFSLIGSLPALESLKLDLGMLSEIPPQVLKLTNINALHIISPTVSTLPAEVLKMFELKQLNLWMPMLAELPPGLNEMPGLETIFLNSVNVRASGQELHRQQRIITPGQIMN
jgi:internalin A